MRFYPAEPDIATIYNRIMDGDIDLQPDFQRGEVWSLSKQQRLIDSILRGWVVPPILVIADEDFHTQQVLDGQQRLVAIRDFKLNKFKIDGAIEPRDPAINALDSLRYSDLPQLVAKNFDKTTIRIYEVKEFNPEEPAEIFFRLNQPTSLTSAEKRNAFIGPVRSQIRDLVDYFNSFQDLDDALGFSNSRMAFDDIFARMACALEFGTLRKKVTASAITEMYRRKTPIEDIIFYKIQDSISTMLNVFQRIHTYKVVQRHPKLNKATTLSWLLFFSRSPKTFNIVHLCDFFSQFESSRARIPQELNNSIISPFDNQWLNEKIISLLWIYNDRATSRVADASSIILRDFTLWASWLAFNSNLSLMVDCPQAFQIERFIDPSWNKNLNEADEFDTMRFLENIGWGMEI